MAEHGNIAAALVRGAGFAEPFGTPSGPTAWVPPVFPTVIAGVFSVFGVKTDTSLHVLLFLDCVWTALSVLFLMRVLDLTDRTAARCWLGFTVLALIGLQQMAIGAWFSTGGFVGMLMAAVIWCAVQLLTRPSRSAWVLLGILAGVVPLTHASCGLATVVVILLVWWLRAHRAPPAGSPWVKRLRTTGAGPVLLLGVFTLAVGGWTVRNALVFRQFIPLKAAGWYEVWLSETCTRDGVLTGTAVMTKHPFSDPALLADFTLRGEKAFLAGYVAPAKAAVAADPARFARFCLNRAGNIFIYCQNGLEFVPFARDTLTGDAERLVQSGYAARLGPQRSLHWIRLDLPAAAIPAAVGALGLTEPRSVEADWKQARLRAVAHDGQISTVLAGLALAGLPMACLLGTWLMQRGRLEESWLVGTVFYATSFIPNILITHNTPHMLHYFALQAFFIVQFFALGWRRLQPVFGGGQVATPSAAGPA